MKKMACLILITIAALLATATAMGQGIHVQEGATLYISPNTVLSGFSETNNQAIVYVSDNASFIITENVIFSGQIKNTIATVAVTKPRPATAKPITLSEKQIAHYGKRIVKDYSTDSSKNHQLPTIDCQLSTISTID